jgi:hypothetical protein
MSTQQAPQQTTQQESVDYEHNAKELIKRIRENFGNITETLMNEILDETNSLYMSIYCFMSELYSTFLAHISPFTDCPKKELIMMRMNATLSRARRSTYHQIKNEFLQTISEKPLNEHLTKKLDDTKTVEMYKKQLNDIRQNCLFECVRLLYVLIDDVRFCKIISGHCQNTRPETIIFGSMHDNEMSMYS